MGCTKFSEELLRTIQTHPKADIQAIFSIPREFNISYSEEKVVNTNYSNIGRLAQEWKIEHYLVDSVPGSKLQDYEDKIRKHQPDVILVLGWYYMVPKKIRELAKHGAWGIHASLLPKYAGGAPLVWAIINGEKETGVTLFKLDDGVDDGDIIEQQSFPIEFQDDIATVYDKATEVSKKILVKVLDQYPDIEMKVQNKDEIEVYPQRSPEDGEIDLNWSPVRIYNFIRAQAPPYPGAFIRTSDNEKIYIYKAAISED